ncbi:MAG: threonine--tRNA ligase [Candidatus Krumholzibacteriota bacterium]|nr:threonine--tRNA ligase [Candidatus Krumholzibacteriota bacterium]
MVEIIYPDGSKEEYADSVQVKELLGKLPRSISKKAVAARIAGVICDLDHKIAEGGDFSVITVDEPEGLDILRHSASHLMALAVQELFPETSFAIGPSIKDGFYYDFLLERNFTPEDLEAIEKKMRELLKTGDLQFIREVISKEEALELFSSRSQQFKVELINEIQDDTVSIYKLGSFTDLCRGPHIPDIKMLKHFKLLSLAGAYWRGDEKREMLQRVYGTVFFSADELKEELDRREEAKKRDHRKLGPQLGLFDIKEEAGGGLAFWYPKGFILRELVEGFWKKEHRDNGYEMIMTPHIARSELWKRSGHYDYYKENMFIINSSEGQEFVLKPMNCPGHILVYKSHLHSYRDLPVRYAELGTVYRNERSGTLHGLLRVRGFTQDDAHIFCTPEQLDEEVDKCFDLAHHILTTFGFHEYTVELSAHDPANMDKYAGSPEEWQMAESALLKAIEKRDIPFKKIAGEAVFYGPKIDLKLIDAIGRGWQATTIQFDFNLPRRFNVQYVDSEGKKEYVYMIHRALLGSIERFIGTLTEHYAGLFPLWLAPEQVRIIPVGKDFHEYALQCAEKMKKAGIRAECDLREERLGFRIRECELQKVPYAAVCGGDESENGTLDVRSKSKGRVGSKKIEQLIAELVDEVDRKA